MPAMPLIRNQSPDGVGEWSARKLLMTAAAGVFVILLFLVGVLFGA